MAYATWNPSDKNADLTLSNGDLTVTSEGSAAKEKALRATAGKTGGKWYWEITVGSFNNARDYIGVGTNDASIADGFFLGADANGYSYRIDDGQKYTNNSGVAYGTTYAANDIISVALDMDNGKVWFAKNSVWQNSGDPAAGTGEAFSGLTGTLFPMASMYWVDPYLVANFGASAFSYSVPSGFYSGIKEDVFGEITNNTGLNDQFEADTPYCDITDGVGISDLFDAFSLTEEIINSIGMSDTLVRSIAAARSISDGSGISDVISTLLTYEGLITNTVGIDDTLARKIEALRSIQDGLGINDIKEAYRILYPAITDTIFSWDTTKWGWAKSISDSLNIADSLEKILGIPVKEFLTLTDTQTNTWKGTEAVSSGLYIVDISNVIQVYDDLIADGMDVTDAVRIALQLMITDILTCTDTVLNIGKFQHIAEDSMTLADFASKAFPKSISDSFAATDTSLLDFLALLQISDSINITETSIPGLTINQTIADALDALDTVTVQQLLQELIKDGLNFEVIIEIDDEAWECWVLNTGAFHPSVYSGYDYNSFALFNDVVYGCKSDGIYELTGDTDGGTAFHSGIILPETRFGSSYNKKFRKGYFGVSGDDLVMKLETESGYRTFHMTDAETNITRDLRGRKWRISLEDFNELDFVELTPVILSRK